MRFNEFNKITEDMKLPPEKTKPHFKTPADAASARADIKADLDKLGSYKPGSEPRFPWEKSGTVSKATTPATTPTSPGYDAGYNAGQKVRSGINNFTTGAQTLGKKVLSKAVPGMSALDAASRASKGDYVGAGIAGLGAAGSLVPGLGTPIALGAAGINAARDAYNSTPANPTNLNPVTSAANVAAANKGMVGRGGQAPATTPATTSTSTSTTPTTLPADKKFASTGTSVPAQSGYKGSAGAQAIQQANPDKITDVNKIRAGDTIKVGGQDYTIKQGDTLDAIARNQQSTPSSAPATTAPTAKPSSDSEFRQADMDRMKQLAATTSPEISKESTTSLNRIKSLAGLK
jgi:LysM repeat protein